MMLDAYRGKIDLKYMVMALPGAWYCFLLHVQIDPW